MQLLLHQVLDEAAGAALLQQGDDLERLLLGELIRAEQWPDASPLRAATGMRDESGLLSFAQVRPPVLAVQACLPEGGEEIVLELVDEPEAPADGGEGLLERRMASGGRNDPDCRTPGC